ncbi:MAG TPA: ADOP family duplicated permease [Candidatus Angelobacter sp.]|nr:ADOP family duplicated permease [Candidatus Angelobacter sp.]
MAFVRDLRVAVHSLFRTPGLAVAVILTLALGIGANAAIFTLVRGILLKPLVNRDEARLIYVRQSAPGIDTDNAMFSVPEIQDLKASVKSVGSFGDFSAMGFTMVGLGEPRTIQGGVVSGTFFDVMGLHPVLGRLIGPQDDGPNAAGVVVLTYRFWNNTLNRDRNVIGKQIRLGSIGDRTATIIGVLEPCVPYPQETEIIANMVTSPHHLSATMVTGRVHRMTELFGRLAPGASVDQARTELQTAYSAMTQKYPEAYTKQANFQIGVKPFRDEVTSGARTILLVLLAASGLLFIIACCNVANLILARTVRRENELAIRTALGANRAALRRMLLAEGLIVCGAGAALGVVSAQPLVTVLARYASRFSVRALDLTVDSSMLWVGAGLAVVAAVVLAFVPRLPAGDTTQGLSLATGGARISGGTGRRQRIFAVTQIALSFVLLAGASSLVTTLVALRRAQTGLDTERVLSMSVPAMSYGRTPEQVIEFYKESMRRINALPGVNSTAFGNVIPWRDGQSFGLQFSGDGHPHQAGIEDPRARWRTISPGFFAALGVPILDGRDFDARDTKTSDPVVIVSQTLARTMFPKGDAVGHYIYWSDPVLEFISGDGAEKARVKAPHRIIGVTADIDDEHVVARPTLTVYNTFEDGPMFGADLFIHTSGDPYALIAPATHIIRELSTDQPVEHAATLKDVRTEVLTPDRLNSVVFGVFAVVALMIAVVGVAGVLAFSVSARTREFGIRLALGAQPRQLLQGVIAQGAAMASLGVLAGAALGFVMARVGARYFPDLKMPSALPIVVSAAVLMIVAIVASMLPAARAARVDVTQALRSE